MNSLAIYGPFFFVLFQFFFTIFILIFPTGFVSSQIQRSAFSWSAMVCGSNVNGDSTIFARRNARKFANAWRQPVHTARLHHQRRITNRIGRRNKIHKSIGLGPYFIGIKPNTNRMPAIPFHTIHKLYSNTETMHIQMTTGHHFNSHLISIHFHILSQRPVLPVPIQYKKKQNLA